MQFMVEMGEKIDAHSYPATTEELVEAYGDLEFKLPNGTETFGEAMDRLADETFENAEEARLSTYQALSSKAIGRKHYSDRDAPAVGEDGREELSF